METLGHGLEVVREIAHGEAHRQSDPNMLAKLTDDLVMEARKFLLYRREHLRERQWTSIHRLRALYLMLVEVRAW